MHGRIQRTERGRRALFAALAVIALAAVALLGAGVLGGTARDAPPTAGGGAGVGVTPGTTPSPTLAATAGTSPAAGTRVEVGMYDISFTPNLLTIPADAPVTIVAFTDYQCPSCAAMHPELERLVKEYGDKVRLVTRDFPLSQHTEAFKAAEAAEAARDQGKYWEYIQILLRNQSALTVDKLKGYASELALDRTKFDSALDSGKFAESVQRDIEDGMKLGINGTPTIFINGDRFDGVPDFASLFAALSQAAPQSGAGVHQVR